MPSQSTTKKRVRKAVIPVAGLGTRFLPATKAIPKEMIPIIDIPMIQYIIQEAVQSGMEEIILITAEGKDAILDHFCPNLDLEARLKKAGKLDLLAQLQAIPSAKITSVRQGEPLGLGHAILTAAQAVGNEPFAILLGDDMVDGTPPCTSQLIDVFERNGGTSVVGVMEVKRSETSKYGMVGGKMLTDRLMEVSELVEKPAPDEAPSLFAIPGRYVLTPTIFDCLRETPPGRGGEIQLTDGLQRLAKKEKIFAYRFEGDRYDTGDRLGYLDATLEFALRRPELAPAVKELLKKHLGRLEAGV